MHLTTPLALFATNLYATDLYATDLYAKGFLAGVGKFLLFAIVLLVLIGVFIGFKVSRRR